MLSDHALGNAVDFDDETNKFYLLSDFALTNRNFNDYLYANMGKTQSQVSGWEDNRRRTELYRNYPAYLLLDSINRTRAYLNNNSGAVPALSFTLDQTFIEAMRQRFDWGSDWE